MHFKDISFLELWLPFCSVERNHFCNFGRGYKEKQFCELIFKFGLVVQEEMSFEDFIYLELLAALLFSRAKLFVQF